MKNHLPFLIVWVLLHIWWLPASAQNSVSAAGGDGAGAGGTISYTVGQIDYLTVTAPEGSAAQGVQQPFEIFQYVAVEKPDPETMGWMVFPNPFENQLIIKSLDTEFSGSNLYTFQIFDISGKILISGDIQGITTTLLLTGWSPGVYMLRISAKREADRIFCIIKK